MYNIVTLLRIRLTSFICFASAIGSGWLLYATRVGAQQWLTLSTHTAAESSIIAWPLYLLWLLCGGGVWIIAVSCMCLGFTAWRGVTLRPEQYGALVLWVMSSSCIAALYGVDTYTIAPGGMIGTYGMLWLRAVLGILCARMLVWFLWTTCAFVVAYDLLMLTAHGIYRVCKSAYDWYQQYRIVDEPLFSETSAMPDVSEVSEITEDVFNNEIHIELSEAAQPNSSGSYQKPNLNVFKFGHEMGAHEKLQRELQDKAQLLTEKLERFGVSGAIVDIKRGPVVTLYEYQPHMDTKISKIIALEDDLAMALQALSIRIIAPIPGRSVVGFEVANTERQAVTMAALVHSDAFTKTTAQLPIILGVDTVGTAVVADIARMPHLLIAGSTGSGKSVALNTVLMSLICSRTPDECRLILIDPKRIEFAVYADLPHLLFPIVTDAHTASLVLKWVVKHMEERYALLAQHGVRSSREFNQRVAVGTIQAQPCMASLVIVIDELADLMITAGREVEESIARIAQMARAAGIHLVVATQRPSVDVITGLIKVNFPSRIAFRVASRVDSRTILDVGGADKLLGKGDMLFLDGASAQVRRLHGAYVSDDEIHAIVHQIKQVSKPQYKDLAHELASIPQENTSQEQADGLYQDVISYLREVDEISISLLQRKFRIGYNRSARLIDLLEQQGLIMPPDGVRPRKVIR